MAGGTTGAGYGREGFESGVPPATRRALLDLKRQIDVLEQEINLRPRGVVAYSEITAPDAATTGGTEQDIAGLSDTFIAEAGRRYKATAQYEVTRSAASGEYIVRLKSGATLIAEQLDEGSSVTPETESLAYVSNTSLSGTQTWRLTVQLTGGAGDITIGGDPTYPSFLLVEDIGPL